MEYGFDSTSVSDIGGVVLEYHGPREMFPWLHLLMISLINTLQLGMILLLFITITDKLNHNPRMHLDDNYLISTAQVRDFGVAV